jgi:ABC-type antimicrobial peptide transport system permease subunit
MLAELFACVLAVSVLAAILPARHASRIVPSAALREP